MIYSYDTDKYRIRIFDFLNVLSHLQLVYSLPTPNMIVDQDAIVIGPSKSQALAWLSNLLANMPSRITSS